MRSTRSTAALPPSASTETCAPPPLASRTAAATSAGVRETLRGGPSAPWNEWWLCRECHQRKTADQLDVEGRTDHAVQITTPHGIVYYSSPPPYLDDPDRDSALAAREPPPPGSSCPHADDPDPRPPGTRPRRQLRPSDHPARSPHPTGAGPRGTAGPGRDGCAPPEGAGGRDAARMTA